MRAIFSIPADILKVQRSFKLISIVDALYLALDFSLVTGWCMDLLGLFTLVWYRSKALIIDSRPRDRALLNPIQHIQSPPHQSGMYIAHSSLARWHQLRPSLVCKDPAKCLAARKRLCWCSQFHNLRASTESESSTLTSLFRYHITVVLLVKIWIDWPWMEERKASRAK